ncbi:MAG: pyridoxal phosphate-dependent class II aminotransferase [Deltaproteobacteria bacterium]|nr:pyridoxal phosphate-dependent class II aminotransferase [Deltaproteobacteria bacterium]
MEFDHGGYAGNHRILLDFSSNVNPLPFPPKVKRLFKGSILEELRVYPDPFCSELTKIVSKRLNVKETEILFGNGSTELIYLITKVVKPKKVLIFEPTFSEYNKASIIEGASVTRLYMGFKPDFSIPSYKTDEDIDLVFLCHPNNPTGNFLIEERNRIFELPSRYYVIDEAFIDFAEDIEDRSFIPFLIKEKRLIVLRTFTKFFPLAGCRIGYLVANEELIERLKKAQPPWTVNTIAMVLAKLFIDDEEFARNTLQLIRKERKYLERELSKLGFTVFPSTTNFLLIKLKDGQSSKELKWKLLNKGILIRDCSNFFGLGENFIRVCVKRRKENKRLIEALRGI